MMDMYQRGLVVPYTSEEDSSIPDCGMHIGLGNGTALYAGEVSDDLLREHGFNPEGVSWALCIISEKQMRQVATLNGDWYGISDAFEALAASILPPPPDPT